MFGSLRDLVVVSRSRGRAAVGATVAVALAASITGAAFADKAKFRFNAVDQATAKTAVLHKADLAKTWTGGAIKPNLGVLTCANYHPKQSNLVITGAADSDFQSTALAVELNSEVEVLSAARMVELDWKESIVPELLPCLRSRIAAQKNVKIKVTSAEGLKIATVARHAVAFRFHMNVTRPTGTSYFIVDYIFAAQGRAELSLETTAFLGAAPPAKHEMATAERNLTQLDTVLARAIVARSNPLEPGSA